MNLNKIIEALKTRRLGALAKKTGLHYNTLYLIAAGKNTNPNLDTIKKIEKALKDDKFK